MRPYLRWDPAILRRVEYTLFLFSTPPTSNPSRLGHSLFPFSPKSPTKGTTLPRPACSLSHPNHLKRNKSTPSTLFPFPSKSPTKGTTLPQIITPHTPISPPPPCSLSLQNHPQKEQAIHAHLVPFLLQIPHKRNKLSFPKFSRQFFV